MFNLAIPQACWNQIISVKNIDSRHVRVQKTLLEIMKTKQYYANLRSLIYADSYLCLIYFNYKHFVLF